MKKQANHSTVPKAMMNMKEKYEESSPHKTDERKQTMAAAI